MSTQAGAITVRTVLVLLVATWPRRIVVGTLLLMPVIVAALGGLGAAEAESHDLEPGQSVDLGPMTMTPVSFFVSDEVRRSELELTDGAEAWLGVIVRVENTTDEAFGLDSPGTASDALVPQLPEGQNLATSASTADTVLRVADATSGRTALPSVPTEVALMWPIADPGSIGDVLTATLTESTWTYGVLSGEEKWLSLGDMWWVDLPRTELPPTMFEPPEEEL